MARAAIPNKLVVLTFDDGNKSDATLVAPLLKRYGFGATFFITEGLEFLRDKQRCMTWEEIRGLHQNGFEIGNHTGSHQDVRKLSNEAFLSEVEHLERRCAEHGIPAPKSFCYPVYFFSSGAVEVLKEKGYLFARRGVDPEFPHGTGRGPVYDPAHDHPLLIPTTGASGPDWTFRDFLHAVEQARDGTIAVLTFHGVPDGYPWVHTDPEKFKACLSHLHAHGYTVIAMRDLAKYVDPAGGSRDPLEAIQRRLDLAPGDLKCEYAVNPLGLDVANPRFSWTLHSCTRGQKQTACQILVASSEEKLQPGQADKWDSGKMPSHRSFNVAYAGSALSSGEHCFWKVRCWDRDGKASESASSTFEMGLLKKADWQGSWIGGNKKTSSPLLRKEFSIEQGVRRARVYVSGLGYYELFLNGQKVGDHVLDPGNTYFNDDAPDEFRGRVLYVTYDVTKLLKTGRNAVGVMLGHGWYSSDDGEPSGRIPFADQPTLMLQMNVEFQDGTRTSVTTDNSWTAAVGPITANDICKGEACDARLEQPGWDSAGFDDRSWSKVLLLKPSVGSLIAQSLPPIRVMKSMKPVAMWEPALKTYVYDLGQHCTGWAKVRVKGPRGTTVTLRYAGRIGADKHLNPENNLASNLGGYTADQTDTYTLKGGDPEVWAPRFTLHGFRYVEVIGFPGVPTLEDLEGEVVYSAIEPSGQFVCSNALVNQIHHNVRWTFMSSFQSIPQDAADRAERWGWLGDPGFVAEDYIYNFDTASFWSKWLNDIKDSQHPDGSVPEFCPPRPGTRKSYPVWPCWQCSYHLFAWYVYQYYGDERILEEHFAGMKKLVDYFKAHAPDLIIPEDEWGKNPLGDHMEPQPDGTSSHFPRNTPPSLCATAYFYYSAWIVSRSAEVLGKKDEAKRYAALAREITEAYNKRFLNETSNQYATGSQTSNALSLYLGLVPENRVEAVLKNLVDDITINHQGHLSTGIIGTDALEQVLPKYGRADIMYQIATQTTFPSWGYMVANGATTIWEDFEGGTVRKRSLNMKMLCSTEKFFYKDLAGIGHPTATDQCFTIKPSLVGDLTFAKASLKTIWGHGTVEWEKDDSSFVLHVTIPANTSALIFVPKPREKEVVISESGKEIWRAGKFVADLPGLTGGHESEHDIQFEVGSGSYAFRLMAQ